MGFSCFHSTITKYILAFSNKFVKANILNSDFEFFEKANTLILVYVRSH